MNPGAGDQSSHDKQSPIRRGASGRPFAELREWIYGRGRGGTGATRWLNIVSKNRLASRRSRVMSTDPAGDEGCLGLGVEMPIGLHNHLPSHRGPTLWRSAAPAVAKTARLAAPLISGGVSPPTRRTYHRRKAPATKSSKKSGG